MRQASIDRITGETKISITINLDGSGQADVATGVGFFDHMLTHIAKHGLMDLTVKAEGDLHIDAHHTVEDVGICLGKAFANAIGDAKGITRYGHACVPMDEALAEASIDVSGRPFLVFNADIPKVALNNFDAELCEEFMRAFAMNSRCTLHINLRYGTNVHHMIEGIFKAVARAIRQAAADDPRVEGVPSTKGHIEA